MPNASAQRSLEPSRLPKEPKPRLPGIGEVPIALEGALAETSDEPGRPPEAQHAELHLRNSTGVTVFLDRRDACAPELHVRFCGRLFSKWRCVPQQRQRPETMRASVKMTATLDATQVFRKQIFATIDLQCRTKYHPRNSRQKLSE